MISFNFNIRNPWSSRWNCIKCLSGQLTKHKFWELQFDKTADVVSVDFRYTIRQDHAGLFVSFGLFGYDAILNVYDNRHWHEEKGRWINYDDKEELKELYGDHHAS